MVMDISTEAIAPWGTTQKPKMEERIFGVISNKFGVDHGVKILQLAAIQLRQGQHMSIIDQIYNGKLFCIVKAVDYSLMQQ